MKQILLTLEAGSMEDRLFMLEAHSSTTDTSDCTTPATEEPIVIRGCLVIAP